MVIDFSQQLICNYFISLYKIKLNLTRLKKNSFSLQIAYIKFYFAELTQ